MYFMWRGLIMTGAKRGDLVVITGVKLGSDGTELCGQTLAAVVEVGKYDLFVTCNQSSYRKSIFKVSKSLCHKIVLPKSTSISECKSAKVGDFVMSVTQHYSSEKFDRKKGILKEIIDKPWSSKSAKILIGNKYEEVAYDSLIILEE